MIQNSNRNIITNNEFLHTEDAKLMTLSGVQVQLRGVNLGGWLIHEAWMCPLDKEDKVWGSWDTLQLFMKRGFSREQILNLMKVYEDLWITDKDLDIIQELGMNCVRVPFWYGNFQLDDIGTYYSENNMDENPGFQRLDWIIDECRIRGIYVILDMHGAPGFQSDDHSCGKSYSSLLFEDKYEGARFRELTIELWQRIAKRYLGNPAVAAYDLLNEPMNGFNYNKKKDQILWDFYNELYMAIREVDAYHIITMEGLWELYNLPNPVLYNWKNVLYQTHNYNWSKLDIDQKIQDIKDRINWKVPIYVGEFQSDIILDYTLDSYNKNQINWTTWTYKGVKSELNGWFLYKGKDIPLVCLENDSYEEILNKWSQVETKSTIFTRDENLAELLMKYSKV